MSATAFWNSGRAKYELATRYSARKAITPTYVANIERVAVASAKNAPAITNSVGRQSRT
jgi:hypothetical protein